MCNKCNSTPCCCKTKVISKIGKRGPQGEKGPKGQPGPPGPPGANGQTFVPDTYFIERTSFQFINNATPAANDLDLNVAVAAAGTYLVFVEVDAIFNRDTDISETGSLSVFLNGATHLRLINLDNPGVLKKNIKIVLNARVVLGAPGNIYVNYLLSTFVSNPSTSITFQTGSITVLKVA